MPVRIVRPQRPTAQVAPDTDSNAFCTAVTTCSRNTASNAITTIAVSMIGS